MSTATVQHVQLQRERHDSTAKARKRLAWLLMVPLIFFACKGNFSFQNTGTVTGGALPGAVATRDLGVVGYVVIPGIAFSVVGLLIAGRLRRVLAIARRFKMLTLLALLTVVSTAWSQDPSRTLLFGTFYFVCTLFAYYLVSEFECAEIMSLVIRAGIIIGITSLCIIILLPKYGVQTGVARVFGAWNGLFMSRVSAASGLVFLISPLFLSQGRRFSRKQLVMLLFLGTLIVRAKTVTSLAVLGVYVLFLAFMGFRRRLGRKLSVALLLGSLIGTILFASIVLPYLPDILRAVGRDPTLTGRTVIWSYLMDPISKQPILGYGYNAFWQGLVGESGQVLHALHWSFGYAHNGYLEIILQLGYVGLVVFLITLCQALRNAWFCFIYDGDGIYTWYVGLIVITVVFNLDESTVLQPNYLPSILYIVACCGLSQAARQLKATDRRSSAPWANQRIESLTAQGS